MVPTPPVPHMEIAQRAAAVRAPYTKNKDGYRDTLIWLTLLDIAERHPHEHVWLVSNNTGDFGQPEPRNDGPTPLHQDLLEELAAAGLEGRVSYVTNLPVLEAQIAAHHAPLAAEDLESRVAELSVSATLLAVERATFLLGVDPASGALPRGTVLAMLVRPELPGLDQWSFAGGAGRGQGRWSASFSVEAPCQLALALMDEKGVQLLTKELRLSGVITVGPDGVEEVQGISAEALSADPARALRDSPSGEELGNRRTAFLHWLVHRINNAASLDEILSLLNSAEGVVSAHELSSGFLSKYIDVLDKVEPRPEGEVGE